MPISLFSGRAYLVVPIYTYLYERHLNWRAFGRSAIDGDACGDMLEDIVTEHCEDL